jgi:PIN domain nuclease of toxin-antitoxin system
MAKGLPMILDTCAVLWLASGGGKLSRRTLKEIQESPAIYVSVISGFEIALKVANGKLKLPIPIQEWFEKVIQEHGLTLLPLDLELCIAAADLPSIHKDPADRFIIATAKINDMSVVTADENFEKYGVTVLN